MGPGALPLPPPPLLPPPRPGCARAGSSSFGAGRRGCLYGRGGPGSSGRAAEPPRRRAPPLPLRPPGPAGPPRRGQGAAVAPREPTLAAGLWGAEARGGTFAEAWRDPPRLRWATSPGRQQRPLSAPTPALPTTRSFVGTPPWSGWPPCTPLCVAPCPAEADREAARPRVKMLSGGWPVVAAGCGRRVRQCWPPTAPVPARCTLGRPAYTR